MWGPRMGPTGGASEGEGSLGEGALEARVRALPGCPAAARPARGLRSAAPASPAAAPAPGGGLGGRGAGPRRRGR